MYCKRAKCIMVQGTASSVGKSLITTGLCRIFRQDGFRVAPFKSQNMALNSYVTTEGGEMGRAQVVQAEAAGAAPSVLMNPILIKPEADAAAQVIINGKVYGNLSAMEYHKLKPELAGVVRRAWDELSGKYELIVIEGAGSPAEINLRENDLVNMGMAQIADAPVILVGDIDKGGVFASLAGTMLLLNDEERSRVKGIIINKFRGDLEILKPGLKMLEDIVKVPVLGVLPYMSLNIDEEDGFLAEKFAGSVGIQEKDVDIAIIRYPYMSNDSDFNALENAPDVGVRYVGRASDLGKPDMVILPGSKCTVSDLLHIRENGLENSIKELWSSGVPVVGICGGFQMLGQLIGDPEHIESNRDSIEGMGLLDIQTEFGKTKTTAQVRASVINGDGLLSGLADTIVEGYEIHMGSTDYGGSCRPVLEIFGDEGHKTGLFGGVSNEDGSIFGTYIHGIFDSPDFLTGLIGNLRGKKGLPRLEACVSDRSSSKEAEYDRLAGIMRANLDIDAIYEIIDSKH